MNRRVAALALALRSVIPVPAERVFPTENSFGAEIMTYRTQEAQQRASVAGAPISIPHSNPPLFFCFVATRRAPFVTGLKRTGVRTSHP